MRTVISLTTSDRVSDPRRQSVGRAELWRRAGLAFRHAAATLREWRRRSRDRATLATLDERMLRDIGVTRGEVLDEINKPFWRA